MFSHITLRILICDDNKQFIDLIHSKIENYLATRNIPSVIHAYSNIMAIPEDIIKGIDLAFLDIDFSEASHSGIDLAQQIRAVRQDAIIIFVSNYIEYAPEGYEVQAFRYVLKSEVPQKLELYLTQAINKWKTTHQTIQISLSGEKISVMLSSIIYFESQGHMLLLHMLDGKDFRIYASIGKLEQELESKGFLRIHKGFLVNMSHIQQFKSTGAVLANNINIPVSGKNYADQKKKYLLWKGRQ